MEMKKIGLQFFAEAAAEADGAGVTVWLLIPSWKGFWKTRIPSRKVWTAIRRLRQSPEAGTGFAHRPAGR